MSQPLRKEDIFYSRREEETEIPRPRARAKKSFNISRSRLPAVVLSLLLVYLVISFCSQFSKLYVMQRDVHNIQLQVQEMQQKNAALREELRLAQSDAYIEKTAREKIGLIKPGETRIVTVAEGTKLQEVEAPSEENIIAD
ncbi:FtsB family cell division protein [Pelotomaculum propionicicum]|uniref:FtsB family cell division protein n=1 Tax=Pelotomaculum propionicicum TaxID=258475 RepID=UPI003B79BB7D